MDIKQTVEIKTEYIETRIINGKPEFFTFRNGGNVKIHYGSVYTKDFINQMRQVLEYVDVEG